MIYSDKKWNTRYKITPFYKNVMRKEETVMIEYKPL